MALKFSYWTILHWRLISCWIKMLLNWKSFDVIWWTVYKKWLSYCPQRFSLFQIDPALGSLRQLCRDLICFHLQKDLLLCPLFRREAPPVEYLHEHTYHSEFQNHFPTYGQAVKCEKTKVVPVAINTIPSQFTFINTDCTRKMNKCSSVIIISIYKSSIEDWQNCTFL